MLEILLGLKPIPSALISDLDKKATYRNLGATDEFRSHHTSKRVLLNKDVKARMLKLIDEILLGGITNPDLVYYRMEEMGKIPEKDGQKLAMSTMKEYVFQEKKRLGLKVRDNFSPTKIAQMFDKGIPKEQISTSLGLSIRHVHNTLVAQGKIKKRKTPIRNYLK